MGTQPLAEGVGLAWLLLLNGATLLVIRALPNAPGHDAERQILASFPFLACLGGVGIAWVRDWLAVRSARWWAESLLAAGVAAALLGAGRAVWHYRPLQLSYYTELVGGLPGAARLGMEPTYYWDALDDQTLEWLDSHSGPGDKVLFSQYFESLRYIQLWRSPQLLTWPHEPGVIRWYVLQNRPGLFAGRPQDRWLAEHGTPACPPRSLDGVPLLWIFPFHEYERACRETKAASSPTEP
jgi:hypothetical protein